MTEEYLSGEQLLQARDLGAATYLSAYIHLMARGMNIVLDKREANAMAVEVVHAMNHATQGMWCALMKDGHGMRNAIALYQAQLDEIAAGRKYTFDLPGDDDNQR